MSTLEKLKSQIEQLYDLFLNEQIQDVFITHFFEEISMITDTDLVQCFFI